MTQITRGLDRIYLTRLQNLSQVTIELTVSDHVHSRFTLNDSSRNCSKCIQSFRAKRGCFVFITSCRMQH